MGTGSDAGPGIRLCLAEQHAAVPRFTRMCIGMNVDCTRRSRTNAALSLPTVQSLPSFLPAALPPCPSRSVVLGKLTTYFVGKHDGETNLSTAFIVLLASQAGIILGRDYKANREINKTVLKNMFTELVLVWHDIAWYGELLSTYRIKSESRSRCVKQ